MQQINFEEGQPSGLTEVLNIEMDKPIRHFEKDLISIRTGRAHTSMIEDLQVESYGQKMRLRDVATLAAPDARLLTIQPWDKSILNEIEKAIQKSDLGVTPANDGDIIRLQLPQMSESRREEFIKILGKKTEECKIGIRNVRKNIQNEIREAEKQKKISEDFAKKLIDIMQKTTDDYILKVDAMHNKKAQTLRSF